MKEILRSVPYDLSLTDSAYLSGTPGKESSILVDPNPNSIIIVIG